MTINDRMRGAPPAPPPRRRRARRAAAVTAIAAGLLAVAIGLLGLLMAAGGPPRPSGSPAIGAVPPGAVRPPVQDLALGRTAAVADPDTGGRWEVTVNAVRPWAGRGDFDPAPPAGTHYILVTVTYRATGGGVDANPYDWQLLDAAGRAGQYQPVILDNQLNATTLRAGQRVVGAMVFAVTDGAAASLTYAPTILPGPRASWNLTAAQAR